MSFSAQYKINGPLSGKRNEIEARYGYDYRTCNHPKGHGTLHGLGEKGLSFEQSAMLLYPMIRNLVISHGRAAEILVVRKWDLIEFYNKMGIPYLNQSKEDLDEEIAGFARLKERKDI